jgi:hypothetical protein
MKSEIDFISGVRRLLEIGIILSELSEEEQAGLEKPGYLNFPVPWQLENLGLDELTLESIARNQLRVLDLGCGENPMLVRYLRRLGIDAEGIDAVAPEEPGIIRQYITTVKPVNSKVIPRGAIPREDNTYGLVVANSNIVFRRGLSSLREKYRIANLEADGEERIKLDLEEYRLKAGIMLLEALRVTKPGGMIRVYPSIDDDLTGLLAFQGCKVRYEEGIGKKLQQKLEGLTNEPCFDKRTIIYKTD